MISDETKAYYDLKKRNEVRESAKRLRKQFLRYISYVCHSFGGAAKYMELAKRKKKIVYNLANL